MTKLMLHLLVASLALAVGCDRKEHDEHGEHSGHTASGGYSLMLHSGAQYDANKPVKIELMVHGENGSVVKEFEITHEKLLHFIVVKKDLSTFQHVHPEFDSKNGLFTQNNFQFPGNGDYRLFADFAPKGAMEHDGMKMGTVVSQDVIAGDQSKYRPQPLASVRDTDENSGYAFQMSSSGVNLTREVTVSIRSNGKPVTNLEPYLGALGHAVILSEGDLQFVHTHPEQAATATQAGKVTFHVQYPRSGKYKMFVQFQHKGKVLTTSFVQEIQ